VSSALKNCHPLPAAAAVTAAKTTRKARSSGKWCNGVLEEQQSELTLI